jgi:VWFA-related protein
MSYTRENFRMKLVLLFVCLGLGASAVAQSSGPAQDLPAAPSAAKNPPKPAPPPAPAQQQPAKSEPQDIVPAGPAANQPATAPTQPAAKPAPDNSAATTSDASSSNGDEPLTTIKRRVNEVNLVFTVTDKRGHFIKDLRPEDVQILDDHKPPQQVMSFRAETDLPLRVGLLVDTSNSIRDRFRFEQEAAIEFLSQIVRPKKDQAFVIGFDTTAEVEQDFTDNTEKLTTGVRQLRPGGGTALFDAVYYACRDKLGKVNPEQAVRRAIVLVTDGDDNQSRVTREEAIDMAQRAEVIIYAISTNISGNTSRGDKVLERLADATGGRAFFPFKDQDIPSYFSAIQDELRSQYLLAYRPADFEPDGRFRSIEVLAKKNNLRVRTRRGYYAPRQ